MLRKLASIKLTFTLLMVLIFLMGVGIWLSLTLPKEFKAMNLMHILDWLVKGPEIHPMVLAWFLGVCLMAAMLGLNAFSCALVRLWPRAAGTLEMRHWVFLVLHLMFLLVLGCHGLLLFMGDKESQLASYTGDIHTIGPYTIAVKQVTFSDDMALLEIPYKERRPLMTRDRVHIEKNIVEVDLLKNGEHLTSKKIIMLSPLRWGNLQLTLTEFLPPRSEQSGPGAYLSLTQNALNLFFFSVYAAMILLLAGFTALTWNRRH